MSLLDTTGIPIPISALAVAAVSPADFEPPPQIDIPRSPQHSDAWCYAACAEMVISRCTPETFVDQCEVAGFVKGADCCFTDDPNCTDSGCQEEQISEIFDNFGIAFQPEGQVDLSVLATEIEATPGRPVEILIEWNSAPGENSAHTLLITGVIGSRVFVVDPLGDGDFFYYGGWQDFDFVRNGFGQGAWVLTWVGLKRKV
jgi:hypothetical protein